MIAPVAAAFGPGSGPVSSNPENVPWKCVALALAPSSVHGVAINVANASILKRMSFSLCVGGFRCDANFRCGRGDEN